MDEGKRVRPFPKCIKLRLAPVGALPPDTEALAPDKMVKADLGHEIRLILARSQPGFLPYGSETNVKVLVELRRGTAGDTSLMPLEPEAALNSVLENIVSPDFDTMEIVRFVKRQAESNRLFRLTVAPGARSICYSPKLCRNSSRLARAPSFLTPENDILVPGTVPFGLARNSFSAVTLHSPPRDAMASE